MQKQPEMTLMQLLQYLDNNRPVKQSVDHEYYEAVYPYLNEIDMCYHNYAWASYNLEYDNGITISYIYSPIVCTDANGNVLDVSVAPCLYTGHQYTSHIHKGLVIDGVTLTDYGNLDIGGAHMRYVWDWIAREFGRMQHDGPAEAVREHLESLT